MDATTFTSMHYGDKEDGRNHSSSSSGVAGGVASLLSAINPKEMALEAVNTVTTWTSLCVSQCFSKMRRVQFDEEHQRSLLSCHTTEDVSGGFESSFPDEQAMLELRRRIQKVDLHTQKRPMSFAQELEATYNRHKALQQHDTTSMVKAGRESAISADGTESSSLSSDTEQALNDILGTKIDSRSFANSDPSRADDMRRLSVDELLAFPIHSHSHSHSENGDDDSGAVVSEQGRLLREWLSGIDTMRASEFVAYAKSFEKQGFQSLDDLAQLDDSDVEQAMSEVGISKFAHRARIRKAILKLSQVPTTHATTTTATVTAEPATAG